MSASRTRRLLADRLRNELEIETPGTSSLSAIFEEEPPPLTAFVADVRYMGNPPLSPPQYDLVRHFEQVLYPATYIDMVEEFGPAWAPVRYVNELAAEWGKGSGKDHVCQISFARVANVLLCLRSPQDYFALPHQTIIHMMNVAASSDQAHGVFFKPLRTLITSSTWFADKFEGEEPGPQSREIRFRKRLELISGHSRADTLEGKNLIAAAADEISAFPTEDEVQESRSGRESAKTSGAILDMLRSSATTRFPHTFKLIQISFPRYKGDAIQQAIAESKVDIAEQGDASRYYASGPMKTWDVNPRYDSIERVAVAGASEPVPNVPSILKDYRRRPSFARAKYECDPQPSPNRYFKDDVSIVASLQRPVERPPLRITYRLGLEEGVEKPQWQVDFEYNFEPAPGAIYAIHGDMAISGDRAGVAMCHVASWSEREGIIVDEETGIRSDTGMVERRPTVRVDFVTAFTADEAAGVPDEDAPTGFRTVPREVQIRWYRKLIMELQDRGFPILLATFDNFQSADTMQILNSRGIESRRQSTDIDMTPWTTLRDVMYGGRLDGYFQPLLIVELQALTRLRNGRVDHPAGGSKDMADALAGAVMGAVGVGGQEDGGDPLESMEVRMPEDMMAMTGASARSLLPESMNQEGLFGRGPIREAW